MIGTKSILARSLDVNEWEFTDEIFSFYPRRYGDARRMYDGCGR
jgi:hypothetical protein